MTQTHKMNNTAQTCEHGNENRSKNSQSRDFCTNHTMQQRSFNTLISVASEQWKVESSRRQVLENKRKHARFLEAQRREEKYWSAFSAKKRAQREKRKRLSGRQAEQQQQKEVANTNEEHEEALILTSERVFAQIVDAAERSVLQKASKDSDVEEFLQTADSLPTAKRRKPDSESDSFEASDPPEAVLLMGKWIPVNETRE